MKVWLEPYSHAVQLKNPYCSVLTRMEICIYQAIHMTNSQFNILLNDAAMLTLDLSQMNGEIEPMAHAVEVRRQSLISANFARNLKSRIETFNSTFQDDCRRHTPDRPYIEWCVAIFDPGFYQEELENFLSTFRNDNWLTIYVVTETPIEIGSGRWTEILRPGQPTRFTNVVVLNEKAFEALPKDYERMPPNGFPEHLRPTLSQWPDEWSSLNTIETRWD